MESLRLNFRLLEHTL